MASDRLTAIERGSMPDQEEARDMAREIRRLRAALFTARADTLAQVASCTSCVHENARSMALHEQLFGDYCPHCFGPAKIKGRACPCENDE